jgi:polar amino acid transport system substrate-binding protein
MCRRALAFVLVVGALTGCAIAPPTSSRSPVVDRIQKSGELRVGMAGDYPPLNALDRSGQNFGLEPELAEFLAKALGVKLRFVNRPFAQLIGAIETGEVDAVLSGMTMTPERNQRVAFAGPYFVSGTCVLTRSQTLVEIRSAGDLNQPSLKLTALEGTTSETLIRTSMPQATYLPAGSYDAAVGSVIAGTADALITDFPICVVQRARRPEDGLLVRGEPLTFEPIGVALPPDDPLFVNLVQNYLASLEKTGILTQLRDRWIGDASWVRRLP